MDFFARTDEQQNELVKMASCEAACTVSAEWAPDGRHFMTAVLAPRMRVDNGVTVWHSLSGSKVGEYQSAELHEVQWKPELETSTRFTAINTQEIEYFVKNNVADSNATASIKRAYRPPGAGRGEAGMVSQMMRGDVDNSRGNPSTPSKPKPAENDGGVTPQRKSDQERASPQEKRTPINLQTHGAKRPCPETGWQYMDPKGNIQGPFTSKQMQGWCDKGAFKPHLKMRCDPEDRFIPFSELFPFPMVPFQSYPKRPNSLREAMREMD